MRSSRTLSIPATVAFLALLAGIVWGTTIMIERQREPTASVTLRVPHVGSTVYLDNRAERQTDMNNEIVTLNGLTPGMHLIIVAHDGRWPWAKQVRLDAGQTRAFTPFNIEQAPLTRVVASSSVERIRHSDGTSYANIAELFGAHHTAASQTSSDGSVSLAITETNLSATWRAAADTMAAAFCVTGACTETIEVFPTDVLVTRAAFLPDSRDHIVFAARNLVSAIELDATGTPQNIQPIYRSVRENTVDFALIDRTIYIRDGETVVAVDI